MLNTPDLRQQEKIHLLESNHFQTQQVRTVIHSWLRPLSFRAQFLQCVRGHTSTIVATIS